MLVTLHELGSVVEVDVDGNPRAEWELLSIPGVVWTIFWLTVTDFGFVSLHESPAHDSLTFYFLTLAMAAMDAVFIHSHHTASSYQRPRQSEHRERTAIFARNERLHEASGQDLAARVLPDTYDGVLSSSLDGPRPDVSARLSRECEPSTLDNHRSFCRMTLRCYHVAAPRGLRV